MQSSKSFMKQFCVYSLKRSGQHAIINWFVKNYKGSSSFFNNINSKNWTVKPEEIQSIWNKVDCLICNVEDYDFSIELQANKFIECIQETPIFILRNPFNLIASRIAHGQISKNQKDLRKTINTWKMYARKFLIDNENFICFDFWFNNRDYRNRIADKYCLHTDDLGINEVLDYGKGSSFDARTYDGNAQKMKVLTRYKNYQKDQEFLDLFDEETILLSDTIFTKENNPFYKRPIKFI